MRNNKAIFGIYKSKNEAETGVTILKNNGFRMSDISVLMPSESGSQDLIHTKATKAPEGAATGAGTGGLLGGVLGLLVGAGALSIPGVGPFIAAGPIMAGLAGLGLGSTVGILGGALIGYGIPEYEAKKYEGRIKEGGVLLSVHVDDTEWAEKAKRTLHSTGAEDIAMSTELSGEMANYKTLNPYKVKDKKDANFKSFNNQ